MNAEIFSEWMRRSGHVVCKTHSSRWYNASYRVYQAFPYHWELSPLENEVDHFLKGKNAIAIRYSTNDTNVAGYNSYHAICDDRQYSLKILSESSRRNVRIGFKHYGVEPISIERYAKESYELALDTAKRQGRIINISRKVWEHNHLAAMDLPGFEAWGAVGKGRIVSSLLGFQFDLCFSILAIQSHRDHLKKRASNALLFAMTENVIRRPSVKFILGGLHSLDAPPSVDEFKFRMGYRAKPVKQRIVFNKAFVPIINPLTIRMIDYLQKIFPKSIYLSKSKGMIQYHLLERQQIGKNSKEVFKKKS